MARRVNTRFVITLGAVLVAAVAVVALVFMLQYSRQHDPAAMMANGKAALAAGDKEKAIFWYQGALKKAVSSGKNTGDSGEGHLATILGNLLYDTSSVDPHRYPQALDLWRSAIAVDPTLSEPLDRLLEEEYLACTAAHVSGELREWQEINDLSTKALTQNPKNAKALLYRAAAGLHIYRFEDNNDDHMAAVQKDLLAARVIDPKNDEVITLLTRFRLYWAGVLDNRNQPDDANKLRALAKTELAAFLKNNPTSAKAWLTQALFYVTVKDNAATLQALTSGLQAAPNDKDLQEFAVDYYDLHNDRPNAERALKALLAIDPKSMDAPLMAAQKYRQWNRLDDAIAMYKQCLANRTPGFGVEVRNNSVNAMTATFMLCQAYMDQAESLGVSTPRGKIAYDEAKDLTDKYRETQPNNPIFYLLDGRLDLLQGQVVPAIDLLRKADDYFSATKRTDNVWQQIKVLLAMSYEQTGDSGLALRYFDEYVAVNPGNLPVQAQRAVLQIRTMKYDDALHTTDLLLTAEPDNVNYERLRAQALQNAGRMNEAELIYAKIAKTTGNSDAAVQLATVQFSQGNYEAIAATLEPVLAKDPGNERAVSLATVALIKLNRIPDARKIVDAAHALKPDSMQLGILSEALAHPESSIAAIQKQMIDKIPDPFDRAMGWAQFYAAMNDHDKELQALQDGEKIKPDDPDVIDRIFGLSLSTKNKDLSERYVQRAQALNLDGVGGGLYAGRYEFTFGDKDKGLDLLQRAVNDRPDFSAGWTIYGQALAESGKTKDAIDALAKAIDERPDNVPALRAIVQLYFSQDGEEAKRSAARYLEPALKFAPRDPVLRSYEDVLGNPTKVIADREALRVADPENEDNLTRLAVLYSQNGLPNKAIEILRKLNAKHPNSLPIADMLARLYRETQNLNDALGLYQPFLLSKDPAIRLNALLLYGDLQRSMNQTEEAAASYEQAIALDTRTDSLRRLGDLRFESDDMPGAAAAYKKILDRDHDVRVMRRYVETLIRQDKFQQADDMLASNILKNNPKDPEGLVLSGYSLLRQHKAQEALDRFNAVLDNNPDNTDALHYRAFTNFSLKNDRDSAINDLTRIRSLRPGAVNSRLLLARVYRVDKQYSEASEEYKAVLAPGMRPDLAAARLEYAEFLYTLCEAAVRLNPDSPSIEASRIRAAKPVETLTALMQDSMTRYPQQAVWAVFLGNLEALTGDTDTAIAQLSATYNKLQAPNAGIALATVLISTHRYDEAMALLDDMLKKNPNAPELYVKRDAALAAQKHIDEALAEFTKAFDVSAQNLNDTILVCQRLKDLVPNDAGSKLLEQRLAAHDTVTNRIALAHYDDLISAYAKAIAVVDPLAGKKDAPYHVMVLHIQAMSNHQLKTPESLLKAKACYQELVTIDPTDMESINNMAYLLAQDIGLANKDQKSIDEAQIWAKRAAALLEQRPIEQAFSVSANVLDTIGWVYFIGGDMDGALENLNQSILIEPLPIAFYHRARLLHKQEKNDEARDDVTMAVKLAQDQNDPILPDAQALLDELRKLSAR